MLALLALLLVAGFLCPLYADEIAYRMQHSRLFLDHGRGFTLFPQCFPADWELAVSPLSYPYRALESLVYNAAETPLIVRTFGILKALVLLALSFRVFGLLASRTGEPRGAAAAALAGGAYGIGVAPWVLVINRPEQEILLAVFFTAWLLLRERRGSGLAATAGFLVALLFALATHPNALFFLPLWAFAALALPRARSARLGSLAAVVAFSFDRVVTTAESLLCPRDPETLAQLRAMTLSPRDLFGDPISFVAAAAGNLAHLPDYARSLFFAGVYSYGWAPFHPMTPVHVAANVLVALVVAALALAALAGLALSLAKAREADRGTWIGWCVALAWAGIVVTQQRKFWYNVMLITPPLTLMAAAFWPALAARARFLRAAGTAAVAATFASLLVFAWSFVGEAPPVLRAPGANLVGGISFSGFGYAEVTAKLRETAALCGIDADHPPRRLGVDALTYWAFRRGEEPIDVSYLSGVYVRSSSYASVIGSLDAFLKERGSSGIVARCNQVADPALRERGKAHGQFCCWTF
jgi:hypothetical protein